jgi:hypothetical protein
MQAAQGWNFVACISDQHVAMLWQQRRMLVNHGRGAARQKISRKHAQKARQHDQVGRERARDRQNALLPVGARDGAGGGVWHAWQRHKRRRDVAAQRALQAKGVGLVAEHKANLRAAELPGVLRVEQRLQVGAAAGKKHGD